MKIDCKGSHLIAALAVSFILGCRSERVPLESETTFARDALQKFVDSGEIAGAISVFIRPGAEETACLGYADREAKRPIGFDDPFMQCSQTKGFCGAAVVEQVTGMRWEEFLRNRVLDPLEMKDTGFRLSDARWARRIVLYDVTPGAQARRCEEPKWMRRPYDGDRIFASAGAGLWTTVRDQLKFYRMLMNLGMGENGVRILKEETVRNLLAKSTRPKGMGGYSLGLVAPEEDGVDEWFGHGGAWNTQCSVNWHKRCLKLWTVQFYGEHRWEMCKKERETAAELFFGANLDTSAVDAYTGRLVK